MKRLGLLLLAFAAFPAGPAAAQDEECGYRTGPNGSAELSPECEPELAAMPSDEDRADLLFRLAYAMNEDRAALGALEQLQRVVALAPENANYWHELGYTQGDLGMHDQALASLDRALAIDTQHANALNERGWVRQTLGDFAGANDDYDRLFTVGPDEPGARMAYARNLVWLGRLDEAETALDRLADNANFRGEVDEQRRLIERIRNYRPEGDPATLCEITAGTADKERAEVLFDACTRAFLDSDEAEKRADFLTVRATARQVIEQSLEAGYDDLRVAAGIDPGHGRRFVNTGFSLLQRRHSWAARNEFKRALELGLPQDQMTAIALAGRAQANYNLGEFNAAFADAKASFETEPTAPALMVLGDLAFDRSDHDSARLYYMGAYHLGSRDDYLTGRLREVGVDDPDNWREE